MSKAEETRSNQPEILHQEANRTGDGDSYNTTHGLSQYPSPTHSTLPRTLLAPTPPAHTTPPQRKATSLLSPPLHLPGRAPSSLPTHKPGPGSAPSPTTTTTAHLALMTTAPNIEMIASSLRHCSLNGGRRRAGSRGGRSRGGDSESDVTIELNSDVALPFHWEQCLDIRVRSISAHTDSVSFVPRARARPPWAPRGGKASGRERGRVD
jgi:hypothetical protein